MMVECGKSLSLSCRTSLPASGERVDAASTFANLRRLRLAKPKRPASLSPLAGRDVRQDGEGQLGTSPHCYCAAQSFSRLVDIAAAAEKP